MRVIPRVFREETCIVCEESEATVLLLPCGHRCLCPKCTGNLPLHHPDGSGEVRCPLCREAIRERYVSLPVASQ